MTKLEKFQIVVGTIVSVVTMVIGWKTFDLSAQTEKSNAQLKAIEQRLTETRFDFERMRDVYDRTEQYLASAEQNEARGRVLVVLINSLPDTALRSELLAVVTQEAKSGAVAAQAADLTAGDTEAKSSIPTNDSFFGDRSISIDSKSYEVRTIGSFGFIDSNGVSWTVPKGLVFRGASVPRVAWSAVGPPLTSDYTIPAILHEHYSTIRTHPSEAVNKMFYEAMLKAGVSNTKAKVLYQAASSFGPRW